MEYHRITDNVARKAERWARYFRRIGLDAATVENLTPEQWERARRGMGERSVPDLSRKRILEILRQPDSDS
jgi:hypothetical protein